MQLEIVILRESSHSQKEKYHFFLSFVFSDFIQIHKAVYMYMKTEVKPFREIKGANRRGVRKD